jgi:hypothetical protein
MAWYVAVGNGQHVGRRSGRGGVIVSCTCPFLAPLHCPLISVSVVLSTHVFNRLIPPLFFYALYSPNPFWFNCKVGRPEQTVTTSHKSTCAHCAVLCFTNVYHDTPVWFCKRYVVLFNCWKCISFLLQILWIALISFCSKSKAIPVTSCGGL